MYNTFGTHDIDGKDDAGNIKFKYQIEGVSSTKIWNVIHKALREYQPCAYPIDGAVELLAKVYRNTKEPVPIISARPDDVKSHSKEWLDTYFKVPYDLHFVSPPKNVEAVFGRKVELINEMKLDAFVEDRFKEASTIAQNCPDLKIQFLLNKPYNKGRRVAGKVVRIDSLYEIQPYFMQTFGHGCAGCPMS
jgi:hypothetical protein